MSFRLHSVPAFRQRLGWGPVARIVACVMVSVGTTLWMGSYGPDVALRDFMGGGLLVPDPYGSRPSIISLIAWFAPLAVFGYLFSDVLAGGLERDAVAVLPRVGSRVSWAAGRLMQLALFSVAFALLGSLASGLGLFVMGGGADIPDLLGVVVRCAVLGFPLDLLLVLVVNCLALRIDVVAAFSAVIGAHAATLIGVAYLPHEVASALVPWLPSAQGILAWHDCSGWTAAFATGVPGFVPGVSLVYLGVCVALVAAVTLRLVRARDVF